METIAAYQHGIYPRSEAVVAATRDLERNRTTSEVVEQRFREDLEDFVRVQQEAGLDYFCDGLLRWQDIFRPLVEASEGLEARTLVRWFDNNSFFRAPEVVGTPSLASTGPGILGNDDGLPEPKVATLPSPYLFSRAAHTSGSRNSFMLELARKVLRPLVEVLVGRGYTLIHLQEPWLVYFGIEPHDWPDLEMALTEIREGAAPRGAMVVLHTYFGDAAPYAERLKELPVDAIGIDFVETDLDSLGANWPTGLVAGCLDGRGSRIEPVAPIAQFVRKVAERLRPTALYLSSNSDLELLPRNLARQKVLRLGEVASTLKEPSG